MATTNVSEIIDSMMAKDYFSQWLGIERMDEKEGYCKLSMKIRSEMCNGFGIAHGGICYSFADSALAFASNSRGRISVSMETSISHIKPLVTGDCIHAIAEERHVGKNTGHYDVTVVKVTGEIVAMFRGTVFFPS